MSIVLWTETPKARKAHACDLCGRPIEKGETYLRMRGTFEGDPYTEKRCTHCIALVRELLNRDDNMHSIIYEEGLPDIAEWCYEFNLHAAKAAFLSGWCVGTPGVLCEPDELAHILALGREGLGA